MRVVRMTDMIEDDDVVGLSMAPVDGGTAEE